MAMENPPFYVGNTSSNGPFPIAMLVYQSVHTCLNNVKYIIR